MNGFFLIDKKKGMTSFDVVKEVRKMTGEKKVGHAGTLDPLAEGLLIVAVGEGTKLLEFFVGMDKEYITVAKFGYVSDTYDAEGRITEGDSSKRLNKEEMVKIIDKNFLGKIDQVPPKFSALKVGGKRAYEAARKGENVKMKSRKVKVDLFEVTDFDWPVVSFKIRCGSGTYIRSLVYDLGQKLGCGAYVEGLQRTKVGDFSVSEAFSLEKLNKKIDQNLISLEEVGKKIDYIELSDEEFEGLKDGKTLKSKKIEQGVFIMAFYKGKLVGILESSISGGIKYKKVIFST